MKPVFDNTIFLAGNICSVLPLLVKTGVSALRFSVLHERIADSVSIAVENLLSSTIRQSQEASKQHNPLVPDSHKIAFQACKSFADALRKSVTVVQAGAAKVLGRMLFHAPLEAHPRLVHVLVMELLGTVQIASARNGRAHASVGDDGVIECACHALSNAAKAAPANTLSPLASNTLEVLAHTLLL